MKKKIIFKGAATALVTPFDALGRIDFTAFGELIERQISEGIDALVICGTTGESATLTDTERRPVHFVRCGKGGRQSSDYRGNRLE